MAGLGRKVFTAGEVLQATDVNGFLMDQAVQVYAGTAARGSALGTSVSEGQVVYLSDTNSLEVYDGSQWGQVSQVQSPNYIINGAFEINQRGFSSITASSIYGHDRWNTTIAGDGTATYTPQTFTPGAAPVAGYEGTGFARFVTSGQTSSAVRTNWVQQIEDVRTLAGQTATISFFAKAGSGTPKMSIELIQSFGSGGSSSVFVDAGRVTLSTSWQRFSTTVSIPSISGKTIGGNTNALGLNLWVSGGSNFDARIGAMGIQNNTFDVWGVQVEAGSVATPFRRNANSLQGEFAACTRYFERISLGRINTATSGSSTVMSLPFNTRKRTTPSCSTNATNANYGSVWTFSQSGVSTSTKSGTVSINFDGAASGTNHMQINATGATYSPTPNTLESLADLYFDASAEL